MDLNESLSQLENAQLVRRLAESDLAYIFKHTLTQESVYTALLKVRRAEIHRAVAEALESAGGDGPDENAAMLALHFERAGVDDKAFTYAALAGDMANRAYAHAEALDLYARAIAIARRAGNPDWNGRVRTIYANRGRVMEVAGNHTAAMENYREMVAFAREMNDLVMEADGLVRLLTTKGIIAHTSDPGEVEHALDLARRSGDQELVGRALWSLGLSVRFRDPKQAVHYLEQALKHASATGLLELQAYALIDLASAQQLAGLWRRSYEYAQKSLEQFRALDNKPMIANTLGMLSEEHYARGEAELARATAEEGLRIGTAIDNPWGIGYNAWCLLQPEIDAGEFDRVLASREFIKEAIHQLGMPLFVGLTDMMLARVYGELGQLERAYNLAQSALRELSTFESPLWAHIISGLEAGFLIEQGQIEQARAILTQLWNGTWGDDSNTFELALIGPVIGLLALKDDRLQDGIRFCDALIERLEAEEMFGYAAWMHYMRSLIRNAIGRSEEAETDLARALQITERAQNRLLAWRVHATLGQVYLGRDERERADAEYREARELIRVITEKISDPALRESFLARPDVEQVLKFQI